MVRAIVITIVAAYKICCKRAADRYRPKFKAKGATTNRAVSYINNRAGAGIAAWQRAGMSLLSRNGLYIILPGAC